MNISIGNEYKIIHSAKDSISLKRRYLLRKEKTEESMTDKIHRIVDNIRPVVKYQFFNQKYLKRKIRRYEGV